MDEERVVHTGETVQGYLTFLSPRAHVGRLAVGTPFIFRVGQRVVATGYVREILDLVQSAQAAME